MTIPEQIEVKKEETLNQQKEQLTDQKPAENKVEAPQEESEQTKNWKKWKENRQREREEALRVDAARQKAENEAAALRQALEAVVNKPQQRQENNGYEEEESEEQRINRKVEEALAKREQQYQVQREQEELKTYPQKLNNAYSDFNQVCSPENLDYLEYHHPELAKSFGHRKEGFDKWSDIYNAVKRYVPNTNSNRDAQKAEKNLQKPQSLSHSSLSATGPTGSSNQLTEQRRAENWARMQKTLKGLNN